MSALQQRLAAALGDDRLLTAEARGPGWHTDISRHELGEPLAWVRPRSTAEVAQAVTVARELGVPVVTVGRRTAYWRPLRFRDALVLDTLGLTGPPLAAELGDGWALFGAGTPVREADDWLRARGHRLPAHPDAFGDTPLGALVAADMASGIGMANATAGAMVTGLRAVMGTGEVLTTGASFLLGGAPFHRPGLPDPTGLLLAAEGALGVVTEVALSVWPLEPTALLSWVSPANSGHRPFEAALALAGELRTPGIWETFRSATVHAGAGDQGTEHDLVLRAPFGSAELERRIEGVSARVARLFPRAELRIARDVPGDPGAAGFERWLGPVGEHDALRRVGHFVGLDVIVPWSGLPAALGASDRILAEAGALPHHSLRRAVYLSPTIANLGLHLLFDAPPEHRAAGTEELARRGMLALAALPSVIPYRWGRSWHEALGPRLDPTAAALARDLRARFDPDGLMQPGVSIFGG
ncbi:MAG: FAD-binding oxidoreductase [Deltaproteobacteria bacterium]|nr:FAD-binding oxidoreductase [Deltaproteobacteria bacterium]